MTNLFNRFAFAVFSCLVLCILFCGSSDAHPFHLCIGQMKWNETKHLWEVSIRLHPQDLETAMSLDWKDTSDKRISTEDSDFPQQAVSYLNRYLFLRRTPAAMNSEEFGAVIRSEKGVSASQDENRSTWIWLGMERERGWLWLHLELQPPQYDGRKEKLWMVNRLLMDHMDRQENTMAIDPAPGPKYSLQFKKGEEVREFRDRKLK